MTSVSHRTYTRLGLMGNPSDGFGGKTITVQIKDFYAEATLTASGRVEIVPHPQHDPFHFDSIERLHHTAKQDGYYGGTRLIYATCKRFYDYCNAYHVELPQKNFRIEYDTNIPRQVGLGGSSAIVVAALRVLMKYYGITDEQIPLPVQPNLAREVETEELEIKAGLQDRVAQIYGGLVYMDFDPAIVEKFGHGEYQRLPIDLLPPLYLAWIPHSTTTSGRAHNRVHYRFEQNDPEVVAAMKQFADYTDQAVEALENRDVERLAALMDANFDLRRRIYGDEVIGEKNLQMVEIARSHGMPAKFTGSGGAITGVLLDEEKIPALQDAFKGAGFKFRRVTPAPIVNDC
ncbi:MAG: mevalonate kinase [Armatimonadota bacterium]|jgi:glucuronokinase